MSTIQKQKQGGFTLVEIAIVLVIIGLLLGGILQGQELIQSARVRSMADQNASIQAAYYGFIDRYRAVPGDMKPADACKAIGASSFDKGDCASFSIGGDGNGRLKQGNYPEASAVWSHLGASNFITGSYLGTAGAAAQYDNTQAPINSYNRPILLGRTDDYFSNATPSIRLGLVVGNSIPVEVLSELDTKIDDGRPKSGILRATSKDGGDYGSVAGYSDTCVDASDGIDSWDVSNEVSDCNAIYLY